MTSPTDIVPAHGQPHAEAPASPPRRTGVARLVVPPLTLVLLAAAALSPSSGDIAVAALSLLMLAIAAAVFAASES